MGVPLCVMCCFFPYCFYGGSDGKESACSAGYPGSMPGLRRSPGEGNGSPLLYSCLENSMERGAWQATVHGVTKCQTWLSTDVKERKKIQISIKVLNISVCWNKVKQRNVPRHQLFPWRSRGLDTDRSKETLSFKFWLCERAISWLIKEANKAKN